MPRLLRFLFSLVALCALAAHAAGPRWVAGSPWQNYGRPMVWYTGDLRYWTDSGPLSSSVDHDDAVALVDAAAATWNLPTTYLTLTNGGSLNEDVGSGNVFLGSDGPIWPADVDSASYQAKPIAVIFDRDGTLTDMLLGGGASAPENCRAAAVTESVDRFIQPGLIAHAVILLNGRCTGPAPEQQEQMRYQLMRAFGRVLGLGWSQTNDNVFTGSPTPTYAQQMHWPIMHPIDIVCGAFTYQCLPEPFTLRDDDVASIDLLYDNGTAMSRAAGLEGYVTFQNGMQAAGINLAIRRSYPFGTYGVDPYEDVSAVTGYQFKGKNGNPISGPLDGAAASEGTTDASRAGFWIAVGIPIVGDFQFMYMRVEPQAVNPLYVGRHAVGPYDLGSVAPPAEIAPKQLYFVGPGGVGFAGFMQSPVAGLPCPPQDGTEANPVALDGSGQWSSSLCGYGHSAWSSFAVRSGRTATVEVSATDESGTVAGDKAMPVIGLWHASDDTGTLPTVAATHSAFNGRLNGMTQMRVLFDTSEQVRLGLSDERGDGRPDFGYTGRVLYADLVEPAQLPPSGGAIRILGMGFQPGNTVTVGGISATVSQISATEIDAVVPPIVLATSGSDVVVTDLRTGGSTTIIGGIAGSGTATDTLQLVRAPSASLPVGLLSAFAVRLTDAAGNPVANSPVEFSARGGTTTFKACQLSTCTLHTNADGVAQSSVFAASAGPVTLEAVARGGISVSAQFTAVAATHLLRPLRPLEYVAAGTGAAFLPAVAVLSDGTAVSGQFVTWSSPSTTAVQLLAAPSTSDGLGVARVPALASLQGGQSISLLACSWTETLPAICTPVPLLGVAAADLRILVVSGGTQVIGAGDTFVPVVFRVTDIAGHGVAGATVEIHQAVTAWQPPCPASGRCPTPPVYGTAVTSAVSDDDGLLSADPLQYARTAAATKIVAATGTVGYASITLEKRP